MVTGKPSIAAVGGGVWAIYSKARDSAERRIYRASGSGAKNKNHDATLVFVFSAALIRTLRTIHPFIPLDLIRRRRCRCREFEVELPDDVLESFDVVLLVVNVCLIGVLQLQDLFRVRLVVRVCCVVVLLLLLVGVPLTVASVL